MKRMHVTMLALGIGAAALAAACRPEARVREVSAAASRAEEAVPAETAAVPDEAVPVEAALAEAAAPVPEGGDCSMSDPMVKTDEEWRRELSPEQYEIMRRKGTERPFTGKYWDNHEKGIYRFAACGAPLFSSDTKYDSGSGWPSFWEPVSGVSVRTTADDSHLMHRTEVLCARCSAHLGHVFEDGPQPTGLRYCINSASLDFEKKP